MFRIPTAWATLAALLAGLAGSSVEAQTSDDCATALVIANLPASFSVTNAGATPSVGLLSCDLSSGGSATDPDVWFAVTAPFDGLLVVSHNFNPMSHAVYVQSFPGTCPSDLDLLYCDIPDNQNGSITPVTAGGTYLVRCGDDSTVTATFTIDIVSAPSNDLCDSPTAIPSLPASVPFDTTGATETGTLPSAAPCATSALWNRDVWYEFTPNSAGTVGITLTENALIGAYLQPAPGLCPAQSDFVGCGTGGLSLTVSPGVTYLIRIGLFYDGFTSGTMAISAVASTPPNNDCTSPQSLALSTTVPVDTLGATASANATLQCQFHDDLWYTVVAPADGNFHVQCPNLTGQVFESPGAGICPTNFDLLPQSGCFTDGNSCLFPMVCYDGRVVAVTGGQEYLLRIGGDQWQTGPSASTLRIDFSPLAPNDTCATAEVLPFINPAYTTVVSTYGASPPACQDPVQWGTGCVTNCGNTVNSDVWFRFTAPYSGTMRCDFGPGAYPSVILYDGSLSGGCPTTADGKICIGNSVNGFERPVVGGVDYFIRISTLNQGPPMITSMTVRMLGVAPNDVCTSAQLVSVPTPAPIPWDNTNGLDSAGLSCLVSKDIWYAFIAPTAGQIGVTLGNGDVRAAAYHDPSGGTLCPTDSDLLECYQCQFVLGSGCISPGTFDFPVQAGQRYLLRLGGWNQTAFSGDFELDYVNAPPAGVVCDGSVPDQVTASYSVPAGSDYDLGVDVHINGALIATIPQTQSSYTHLLGAGFTGTVEVGFAGRGSTMGSTGVVACEAAYGAPANDLCANALSVTTGTTPYDTTISILDPSVPTSGCAYNDPGNDLWFEFVAPVTEQYTISNCNVAWNDIIEVWDGTGGCPAPGEVELDCAYGSVDCSVTVFATAGNTYYIRVLGSDNAAGPGELGIVPSCPALTGLTADYDCSTGSVVLTWDGGVHTGYEVYSDLGLLTSTTAATYTVTAAQPGYRTYEVVGFCPNGAFLSSSIDVFVADLAAPATDLLLALDGVRDGGIFGLVDSASALEAALLANGRTVTRLAIEDFDQFPCFSTLAGGVENIWVLLGTFPWDYRLSAAEGSVLASLNAAGKGLYLEGGQHWGGLHVPSPLDDRDGIEPAEPFENIEDGDDSFTLMDGLDSGLPGGDFSGFSPVAYLQDSGGNDLTDRLVVTGTDPVNYPVDPDITAAAIWVNSNDASPTPEPAYITGVHAVHDVDGGVMISTSWEFGGFDGDLALLAERYLDALEGAPVVDPFRRGDCNDDSTRNIADPVRLLGFLFPPPGSPALPVVCPSACDSNDDGALNIADAVSMLGTLFPSGPPIPWNPPDSCGGDPTPDALTCPGYTSCP